MVGSLFLTCNRSGQEHVQGEGKNCNNLSIITVVIHSWYFGKDRSLLCNSFRFLSMYMYGFVIMRQ